MKIRVNHGELDDVKNKMMENSNALFIEINGIIKDIETLKTMWSGEDANIFYTKVDNYLQKLKSVPEAFNSLSKVINKGNIMYKNLDIEAKNEIEKVRMS